MFLIPRIALIVIGLFVGQHLAASVLVWDRTEAELEMTPEQKEIRASFNVTNEGESTVRISRIKTSCGCTGSIIDRKILAPGATTEVIATFNRGRRRGLNENRLEVFIDSQKEAVATLRMTVEIPVLIDAVPQIVYWSPTSSKTHRQVRVSLDERYMQQIELVDFNEDRLTVLVEQNPEDPNGRILKITPHSFDELQRETIRIRASGPNNRTAEAKIHALIQP